MQQTKTFFLPSLENLITALYRDIDESLLKEREELIEERKKEMENASKPEPKKAKKGQNVRQWVQATTAPPTATATATTSGTSNTLTKMLAFLQTISFT